jgi:Ca-activated chloride channel family protein
MIRFLDPQILWLLALLPLLALWRGRRGPVAAIEYSNADLARQVACETRSRGGRWLVALPLAVFALLIIGMARPQLGHRDTTVQASGIDMMLAVDVSGSMQSLDFKVDGQPVSRVDVVKSVVGKFIEARPDDRIGMIEFAHGPYLVCPLTLDHDWLLQNLDRVQIGSIDDGTAIGSGIAACVNRLRDQPGKSKVVVLLTDGQNNCGKVSPLMAAEAARALGVKVYTIGVGVRGDAPMPVTDAFGNKQIVMIHADVDEDALQKIATETGGNFYRATDTDSLKKVYADIDQLEKTTHILKKFDSRAELFPWALLPAMCLLGTGIGLMQTRFRRLP